MSAMKTHLLRGTALIGAALFAPAASAQASAPAETGARGAAPDRPDPAPQDPPKGDDTIVVTGSRLSTTEFNSPAPIQVITSESIQTRGITDTASAIQQSSIASGSIQQNQTTVGFGQSGIQGGNGLASANLRGLDALRTLVLVNGRRVTAAGSGGNIGPVDLSVIPLSMVSRIEILKDGGSSVYGSDAIGGVVNIITRRDLNGAFLTMNTTQPLNSGGDSVQIAGGLGARSSRGYIAVTAEYFRQNRLPLSRRAFLNCNRDVFFSPTTGASIDIVDPATGASKCFNAFSGGVQVAGISGQLQYDPSAGRGPYGAYDANPYLGLGYHRVNIPGNPDSWSRSFYDNGLWENGNSAIPETTRMSLFVSAGYDLGSNIHVYLEGLASRRNTWLTNLNYMAPTINAAAPSNPFGRNAQIFLVNPPRGIPGLDPRQQTRVDFYQVTLGLDGTFGGRMSDWRWDIYGQAGRSRALFDVPTILTDAFQYTDGNPANGECFRNGVTQTPISHRSCVAVNWFSPDKLSGLNGLSAAEAGFLLERQQNYTHYDQNVVEGSLTGNLVDLPAGPVRLAIGSQYIYNSIDDEPDPQAKLGNLGLAGGVALPTIGSQHSLDVYGEFVAPLLKNAPLARELTITGSVRASHPQNIAWHWTYEGGVNWEINRLLRVRATYGTSFRAPAIFERVLAATALGYQQGQVDPCLAPQSSVVAQRCTAEGIPSNFTASTAFAIVSTSGNPALKPETSTTWTAGTVLTPSFTDLSIAIDYFDIKLANKITTLQGQEVALCYAASDYPTSPYCSLFTRDRDPASPTFLSIRTVNDAYLNAALEKTNGIDLTIRWNIPLRNRLVFRMDHQYTRTLHDLKAAFPNSVFTENNGILLQPKFSGTSIFSLDRADWTISWNMQVIGATSSVAINGGDTTTSTRFPTAVKVIRTTPTIIYNGITLRKKFDRLGATAQIGVQNLFDKAPPVISNAYIYRRGTSPLSLYDFLGRRVFITLNKSF